MPVVTAGMHRFFRSVFLFEKQAVHITAHRRHRSGPAAVQYAHNAGGASHLFLHLIPCFTQNLRNKGGGFHFAERRFGNCVQVRPEHINSFPDIHCIRLSFQNRTINRPFSCHPATTQAAFYSFHPRYTEPGNFVLIKSAFSLDWYASWNTFSRGSFRSFSCTATIFT